MLEEILKKQWLNEDDIKVINKNKHLLSDQDLIRLGLKEVEELQEKVIEEKPKKRTSKK